jgi:hypothetical protein
MLKFSIKIFLFLSMGVALSQTQSIDLQKKDTTLKTDPYGLRVGVDLYNLARTFYNEDYQGIEFVGDYRFNHKLYLAAELGNVKFTQTEELGNYELEGDSQRYYGELYKYTTNGSYLKLGVDLNTYENWYGMYNTIYVGARLGTAKFSQTLHNYNIYNTNKYWNSDQFAQGTNSEIKYEGLNASWLETLIGVKAELFANFYLGGSVQLKYLIINKKPDNFTNLWIPGFNKVTDGSRFGVGFNYTLTYHIPLFKKEKKVKAPNTPKATAEENN